MKLIPTKLRLFLLFMLPALLTGYACQSMGGKEKPLIKVSDQPLSSDELIIDEVFSPVPGWIIIHKELDGQPGPMLGYCKVNSGLNTQVKVNINPEQATLTLYASLHIDAGLKDILEFPGNDLPVRINGQVVVTSFKIK